MDLKPIEQVEDENEARQIAVEWQTWTTDQILSYGELAVFYAYFKELGEKFGLVEEFQENGII